MLDKPQTWKLEDGSEYSTRDIFAKIFQQEIDKAKKCRSELYQDWQEISARFFLIKNYGVLRSLGQGAFGTVYLAFDIKHSKPDKLGRMVAIKKPSKEALIKIASEVRGKGNQTEAAFWARSMIGQVFSEEALLTRSLHMCPHVVSVLDHDITIPYLVLEYCNGGSLWQRMNQPYTHSDALRWGYEIALALDAAHNLQPDRLIHRDLKPQNILLHNKQVKVSDFGTSKMVHETESVRSLTGGYTPKYAAPEAFDGKAYPATDVWSWGVIMYQLLCGKVPFDGNSQFNLMKKICHDPFEPIEQCVKLPTDSRVYDLIAKCLEKNPTSRPSTQECLSVLDSILSGETKSAIPKKLHHHTNKNKTNSKTTTRRATASKTRTATRTSRSTRQNRQKKNQNYSLLFALIAVVVIITGALLFSGDSECSVELKLISYYGTQSPYTIEAEEATLDGVQISENVFLPGEYTLFAEIKGYETINKKIIVPNNSELFVIEEHLVPRKRQVDLKISTNYPMDQNIHPDVILVNNNKFSQMLIPGKNYSFEIKKAGYKDWRRDVYLEMGTVAKKVEVVLEVKKVSVEFAVVDHETQKPLHDHTIKVNNENKLVATSISECKVL